MMTIAAVLPTGALLPESILNTDSFKILATFVALNTLMYATLAASQGAPEGLRTLLVQRAQPPRAESEHSSRATGL
jgi:hypothetical protein